MHNFTFLGGSFHALVYFGFLGQEKDCFHPNQINRRERASEPAFLDLLRQRDNEGPSKGEDRIRGLGGGGQ